MVQIVPIETPTLGDRSYLVHDGTSALVVDPQRDLDRMRAAVERAGVRVTHVAETHIHNDYLTGGLALARAADAAYLVNADDPVRFERTAIRDRDLVEVGPSFAVEAVATPGHTFTHLSYVLHADGGPTAVFTGGSVLFGSTGRPDLLGPEHTHELAARQWESARRLAELLPGSAGVYPTHGFGSFCSATQTDADESTITRERRVNPALTQAREEFVAATLAGLDEWPAYYVHMGPANLAGPEAADLRPPARVWREDVDAALARGEWVVDVRLRARFAAAHAPGTVHIEGHTEGEGQLATYLGWLMPWDSPVVLLGETPEQVAAAQRELARVGIDRIAGVGVGGPDGWSSAPPASVRCTDFAGLARTWRPEAAMVVLDVRQRLEWQQSHLAGAVHVPLAHLRQRLAELPPGRVWVHCASGARASTAASILAAAGREVVLVDDDIERAEAAGLAIETAG